MFLTTFNKHLSNGATALAAMYHHMTVCQIDTRLSHRIPDNHGPWATEIYEAPLKLAGLLYKASYFQMQESVFPTTLITTEASPINVKVYILYETRDK